MLLRTLKISILAIVTAVLVLAALPVVLQNHLVLPTQRWPWEFEEELPRELPPGMSFIKLPAADGTAVQLFRVARTAPGTMSLLYFHGNGITLKVSARSLAWFASLGFDAYGIDYRGSGYSSGDASEEKLKSDALAAVQEIARIESISTDKIAIFGQSFGTGLAGYVASQFKVAGLILVSPYTSLQDVAAQNSYYRPLIPFMWWDLPQKIYSKEFRSDSVLILHGKRDGIIPFAFGETISKNYPPATKVHFVTDEVAGHDDVWGRHEVEIVEYLKTLKRMSSN